MKAYQIMDDHAEWNTWHRTVRDCYYAIRNVTDEADWWESEVLYEDTLNPGVIMQEVMK